MAFKKWTSAKIDKEKLATEEEPAVENDTNEDTPEPEHA